ncbi:MAG: helix-turn-helix domain-containing protein [Dehalococcoidales bacterium]|nr:helix-turn-helix domain-containing protein [Dehalococcoidales bacterium]
MIGTLLRDRRTEIGMKIRDLAALAGMSAQHLRDIEAGRRDPSFKTLLLLTDLLAVPSSDWLVEYLAQESRLLPLIQMGEHFLQARDMAGARPVLERLRSLRVALRDNRRYQGRVYHLWGVLAYQEGNYARSLVWFLRAEKAAKRTNDVAKSADASYNAALAMMRTGRWFRAAMKFDEAAEAFQSVGDLHKVGYSLLTKANALKGMQSYREALPVYHRAAHFLRGDAWYFDARLGEAICRWSAQSPEGALALLTDLEKHAMDPDRKARYHHNLGVIYRQLGDLQDALGHLAIALEALSPAPPLRPDSYAEMCLCRALTGDRHGARDMLNRFFAFDGTKDPQDVLAMAIISGVLGYGKLLEPLPRYVTDGYEQRISAAVSFLQSQSSQLRPQI